jgi:hypothetical protein
MSASTSSVFSPRSRSYSGMWSLTGGTGVLREGEGDAMTVGRAGERGVAYANEGASERGVVGRARTDPFS